MLRRTFLAAAAALPLAPTAAAQAPIRTRWTVTGSEGFEALAFLGPLSGSGLPARHYQAETAAFGPKVSEAARSALMAAQARADAAKKLLWPTVANIVSYGPSDRIGDIVASLEAPEQRVLPAFRKSPQWDEGSWEFLMASRSDLRTAVAGLEAAGFAAYRQELMGARLAARAPELTVGLAKYDVIAEQERLIDRQLMPTIGVVLLWFSKPYGVSVGGQRSLSHLDYPLENVVRIVAHEMLHPPFPMQGPAALAALEVLNADPLMVRILKEHDPSFGYNTMEGILNEDTVEALDQIVSERLGVARDPTERWTKADGGMHVLAAGLYGTLKAEGYDRTGGNIEAWMLDAARSGKLAPGRLHAAAAGVLKTTPDRLWKPA